jgi:mannitol-specific phosphotransferase system IIBC component
VPLLEISTPTSPSGMANQQKTVGVDQLTNKKLDSSQTILVEPTKLRFLNAKHWNDGYIMLYPFEKLSWLSLYQF